MTYPMSERPHTVSGLRLRNTPAGLRGSPPEEFHRRTAHS